VLTLGSGGIISDSLDVVEERNFCIEPGVDPPPRILSVLIPRFGEDGKEFIEISC
jgi:hypothetical protein